MNRQLMTDQSRWPRIDRLPLKRRKEGAPGRVWPEFADMMLDAGRIQLLYPNGDRTEYADVEAVLDAGWVVD